MSTIAFARSPAFNPTAQNDGPQFATLNPDLGNAFPAEIPIDPALAGIVIDPALAGPGVLSASEPPEQGAWLQNFESPGQSTRDYSQGPQGDPFALQHGLPPAYYAPELEARPTIIKKTRRRRKPKLPPEDSCGYCQGNDSLNHKTGQPEPLVTCDECSRSGHPSCMKLLHVQEQIRTYPWLCQDCKVCEVCAKKGDESRMVFCDVCDRGWHMDCLVPPLEDPPEGAWSCPECPELPEGFVLPDFTDDESRQASLAISEETDVPPSPRKRKRKGKNAAMSTDESDMEVDDEETSRPVNGRGKAKAEPETPTVVKRGRGRPPKIPPAVVLPPSPPAPTPRSAKRVKMRVRTPPPAPPATHLRVRLRVRAPPPQDEGPRKGLFDDVLGKEDRDTSKTTVLVSDRAKFDKAREQAQLAEEILRRKARPPLPLELFDGPGPSTRAARSAAQYHYNTPTTPVPPESPAPSTPAPSNTKESSAPSLRIRTLRFGGYDIQTWFDAPFSEEYNNLPDGRLWMCEFCLKYNKSRFGAGRHDKKCSVRYPPGDEIYRDGAVSIFEVDGRKNKIFCQNLCLLSKMFLDHKSLFYDVEPFLFYVLTETVEGHGAQFIGYFSKEKISTKNYNLSCIMTLPIRQRRGWGNLLIDFSYLLSKKEGRSGTPERPLSAHGELAYTNYWTLTLMRYLQTAPNKPGLDDIAKATSMELEDICEILEDQGLLIRQEEPAVRASPAPGRSIKYSKTRKGANGRVGSIRSHLVRTATDMSDGGEGDSNKSPFIVPTNYDISWDPTVVNAYMQKWDAKGYVVLKPERLKWTPFLTARSKLAVSSDSAVALPTLATTNALNGLPPTPLGTPVTKATLSGPLVLVDDVSVPATPKASTSSPPRERETKTPEIDQVAADAAFAMELANTPPARVTRSRSTHNTPIRRRPSPPQLSSEPPASPIHTLSPKFTLRSGRAERSKTPPNGQEGIEDDEALAVRLSAEDARPQRQTRSSRSFSQQNIDGNRHTPKNVVDPAPRSSLKRKRMDDSLSPEPSPPFRMRNGPSDRALRSIAREKTLQASPVRLMTTRSAEKAVSLESSSTTDSPSPRRRNAVRGSRFTNRDTRPLIVSTRSRNGAALKSDEATVLDGTMMNGRHSALSDTTLVPGDIDNNDGRSEDDLDDIGVRDVREKHEDADDQFDDAMGGEADAEGEEDAEGELDVDEDL